jgi:hypothetical protein
VINPLRYRPPAGVLLEQPDAVLVADVEVCHRRLGEHGLPLYCTGLSRFSHVFWIDAQWLADTTDRLMVRVNVPKRWVAVVTSAGG